MSSFNPFGTTKYVVVFHGDGLSDTIALGPYDTKEAAIAVGVREVERVDTFSTRQEIEDGLACNGRNDVTIARLRS